MYLDVNGVRTADRPGNDHLREAVESLDGKGDSFVILSQDEMSYIQAAGDPTSGYVIEYQDGSLDEHYCCNTASVGTEDLVLTFQSYLAQDDRWKSVLSWKKEEVGAASVPVGRPRMRTVFLILASAALLWMLTEVLLTNP
ncbi:MAG: hypothetical protein ACR2PZ_01450 [Pseudomonadales bacterium]